MARLSTGFFNTAIAMPKTADRLPEKSVSFSKMYLHSPPAALHPVATFMKIFEEHISVVTLNFNNTVFHSATGTASFL